MLLEYFGEHNEFYSLKVGRNTSKITHGRYELTKNRLQEFLKKEYHLSDIPVWEITPVFVEKFFIFLQNDHKCCNNTALKFLQRFRSVFYYIKNTGADIKADPFACFRFQKEKVTREVLTQEEINRIYNKEFETERLRQIRDVFIFAVYTGLSYIDLAQLVPDNIRTAFDGHKWIMINRQKTNEPSNIRLLDIPLEIIRRYEGRLNEKLLPICSNQRMNEYLKEIASLCGINKPMTCHVARHTFATTVALGNDVPMESVQTMLGHADIKTTQIYAHVVDTKLSRDMEKMAQKVNSRMPEDNKGLYDPQIILDKKDKEENKASISAHNNMVEIIDETFFIAKHANLKEVTERDYYFSVVENNFKVIYSSTSVKLITNGIEFIIGSKSFGNILGGFYSLDFRTGGYDDFRYGKASLKGFYELPVNIVSLNLFVSYDTTFSPLVNSCDNFLT